jgi:hypothetical protein
VAIVIIEGQALIITIIFLAQSLIVFALLSF